MVDVHLDRQRLAVSQGSRGPAEVEPGGSRGGRPADRGVAGRGEGDQRGVAAVAGADLQVPGALPARPGDADDLHGDVGAAVFGEAVTGLAAGVAGVLVAAGRRLAI